MKKKSAGSKKSAIKGTLQVTKRTNGKASKGTPRFVPAGTGRVVKSSPAEPRLGRERIEKAVRAVVSAR